MGSAIRMATTWAVPSTNRLVGSRCQMSVETFTRLTNENPQSPCSTAGITTMFWMTRSFILTNSAARLTGSSSVSAARNSLSYSSLRQRVMLRPWNLLSLVETSHDVNWFMKVSGSGWVMVVVYIWMAV